MTFKTAQKDLETALQIAENTDDSASEHLVSGLIELAKALQSELGGIKTKLQAIEQEVKRLR